MFAFGTRLEALRKSSHFQLGFYLDGLSFALSAHLIAHSSG